MSLYVPAVAPLSRQNIEDDATAILEMFYPHLLQRPGAFPALDFFEHKLPSSFHLDTGVSELSDGIEGMTWPDGRVEVSIETYIGACAGKGRARFTICHESYHGIKHHKQIKRVLVDTGQLVLHRRGIIKPYLDPEWQANYFSAAVLMPKSMVLDLATRTSLFRMPGVMAHIFQVSIEAASHRINTLKIQ